MRQKLTVESNSDGSVSAKVPFHCMWDLVEHLAYIKVAAVYQYETSCFIVTFPKLDLTGAQSVLNEWLKLKDAEQPAQPCTDDLRVAPES